MKNLNKSGMTLVEVLLAMLILGMSISVLMSTASNCLSIIRKSRNYETARNLLHRVELEFPIDDEDVTNSETSGKFDDYEDYRWEREIIELDEENQPNLYKITTKVFWLDRNEESSEEIETLRYFDDQESI